MVGQNIGPWEYVDNVVKCVMFSFPSSFMKGIVRTILNLDDKPITFPLRLIYGVWDAHIYTVYGI